MKSCFINIFRLLSLAFAIEMLGDLSISGKQSDIQELVAQDQESIAAAYSSSRCRDASNACGRDVTWNNAKSLCGDRGSTAYGDCETLRNCKGTCLDKSNIQCDEMFSLEAPACDGCTDEPKSTYPCESGYGRFDQVCGTGSNEGLCEYLMNCKGTCLANLRNITCETLKENEVSACIKALVR